MASKYNKKHNVLRFSEGDAVSISIPWIDRTSSDLPRLPCVVVEVTHNIYRLRYGLLSYFSGSCLNMSLSCLLVQVWAWCVEELLPCWPAWALHRLSYIYSRWMERRTNCVTSWSSQETGSMECLYRQCLSLSFWLWHQQVWVSKEGY